MSTVGAATTHPCPALGCEIQVARAKLTCRDHWYSLPPDLRREISATYRVDHDAHLAAVLKAARLLVTT